VHVRVTIPQKLGKDEQKLVEQLRELQESSSSKRSRIFNFGS
jgi:DnaJ-class molecular chaperone